MWFPVAAELGLDFSSRPGLHFPSSISKCLSTSFISQVSVRDRLNDSRGLSKAVTQFTLLTAQRENLLYAPFCGTLVYTFFICIHHDVYSSIIYQISIDLYKSNNLSCIYGRVRIAGIASCSKLIIACCNNNKLDFRGII